MDFIGNVLKYTTPLNVDRTIFINNNDSDHTVNNYYACYNLKDNIKTGMLSCNSINYNEELSLHDTLYKSEILNYGLLDIKYNKFNNFIYSANSDGSISIFDDTCKLIKQDYILKNNNCTNILCFNSDSSEMLIGFNEGEFSLYNIETNQSTYISSKVHEYGIWALCYINDSSFMTGADDNTIHINDKKCNKIVSSYKIHSAGITHISKYFDNENLYLTGSYDESISIFDIRNLKEPVLKQKLNCSIWDIKQLLIKEKQTLVITCIYDGLRVFQQEDSEFKETNRFTSHDSIVYGVDIKNIKDNEYLITSCSLYDNLICYWKLNFD